MNDPLLAFDSIQPESIPAEAAGILYYADGRYAWTAEHLARFPSARRRAITVLGDPVCNVADVETGDLRPGDCLNFLRAWRHEHPAGEPGTIYCSRDTLPAVQALVGDREPFNVWLATLDGSKPRVIDGPGELVAVQYSGELSYDVSAVWNRSWLRRA